MNVDRARIVATVLLGALTLFALTTAVLSALNYSGDFMLRWDTVLVLAKRLDIYDPDVIRQYQITPAYLPSCLAMVLPFAYLGWPAAKAVWLAVNLLLTFLLARDLSTMFLGKKHTLLLAALMVCSMPWRTQMQLGQHTVWCLYFFILAVKLEREDKPILSGLAIALSFYKFQLTIPMLAYFLVYRRSWKNVAVAFGAHGVVHLLASFFLQRSPWYLFMGPYLYSKSINLATDGYLDFFAFWRRLGGVDAWVPAIAGLAVYGALAAVLRARRGKDDLGMLALTAMVSTIILYHHGYDYLIIILALAWIIRSGKVDRTAVLLSAGLFLVGYFSTHHFSVALERVGTPAIATTPITTPFGQEFQLKTVYLCVWSLVWYGTTALLAVRLWRGGPLPSSGFSDR